MERPNKRPNAKKFFLEANDAGLARMKIGTIAARVRDWADRRSQD